MFVILNPLKTPALVGDQVSQASMVPVIGIMPAGAVDYGIEPDGLHRHAEIGRGTNLPRHLPPPGHPARAEVLVSATKRGRWFRRQTVASNARTGPSEDHAARRSTAAVCRNTPTGCRSRS